MKKYFLIFLSLVFVFGSFSVASAQDKIEVNFFYSSTCSHCAAEEKFLDVLGEKYPDIEINRYEVISNTENQKLLGEFYEERQVPKQEQGYVPVTFTPTDYFVGFSDQIAREIEGCLEECMGGNGDIVQKVKIPFFGEIDISTLSLPVLTIIFGALDGLNPCAMWILIFLIALLVNTKSRKRMWLVGGTFVLASGIIYYLILTAWLNLFLVISYVTVTRILIGALALGVGVWQIKNFLTYHPGVCKVLGLKAGLERKFTEKAEKIVTSPITIATIFALIVLAFGVNLVEFFCSSGLPAIYTRILTLSDLSTPGYYLYLLFYTIIFMLDDFIVLSLAAITLSKVKTTERYSYWATLIGGLLMLILGILLIFKPEILMFA